MSDASKGTNPLKLILQIILIGERLSVVKGCKMTWFFLRSVAKFWVIVFCDDFKGNKSCSICLIRLILEATFGDYSFYALPFST